MGVWKWPWRYLGFSSSLTAEQVTEGIDAGHLTAIVTGATSGLGKETARVLALRGAKVIIPSRTLDSGMKVKEDILEQIPGAKIQVLEMDLSSLSSVKSFAGSFDSSNMHLNILINNAGIFGCPFQLSEDGIELQFATNHLGHFLLTKLLLKKMKDTARETGIQGRIINVSSTAHSICDGTWLQLDKITDESRYKPYSVAYPHTKLANILHANELSRQLKEEGANVTANSLHPGVIITNIIRYLNINGLINFLSTFAPFVKSIPQGAATSCYVALHPDVNNVTGKYFVDCKEKTPSAKARDEALGKQLWDLSEELTKRNQRIG